MKAWAGRRVARIVRNVLHTKGTTCHLCGLPGADSADHDPPRSVLIDQGVVDPDAMKYLKPCHRIPCNVGRGARPITDELRAEMRAKRLRYIGAPDPTTSLSSRFADRRPRFSPHATPGRKDSFPPSLGPQKKPLEDTP